jgi:hypothetical protein
MVGEQLLAAEAIRMFLENHDVRCELGVVFMGLHERGVDLWAFGVAPIDDAEMNRMLQVVCQKLHENPPSRRR